MRKGFLAALILLTLTMAGAKADGTYTYGGSGMDVITEIIPIEGGALAVGRTNSNDGTFQTRSRKGMAGWVLCLNETGDIRWTHCTAHAGRVEFHSPYEHQNGMLSCILGDGRTGEEWIWYDKDGNRGSGQTKARIDIGKEGVKALPLDWNGEPALALLHGDWNGRLSCGLMDAHGRITNGEQFEEAEGLEPFADSLGRIVFARQEDGQIFLRFVTPGGAASDEIIVSGCPDGKLEDAAPRPDGTLLLAGETQDGGYIACVNGQGETVFAVHTEFPIECVSASHTGFSALSNKDGVYGNVLYEFDEGGKLKCSLDKSFDIRNRQMADTASGALVIERSEFGEGLGGVSIKYLDDESQYSKFLFKRKGELLSAQPDGDRLKLFVRAEDGEEVGLELSADGVKRLDAVYSAEQLYPGVTWQETAHGTKISRRVGEHIEETNVPIHTAADQLEWLCALPLEDGGLLLGGRYLSENQDGMTYQQAVLAQLDENGILCSLETLDHAGCVSGIAQAGEKTLLLISRGFVMGDLISEISTKDGEVAAWLNNNLKPEEAHLFCKDGAAYLAGTADYLYDGEDSVIMQKIDLE